MFYLRYLRQLLAEQDDPRAALLLEELPQPEYHLNPDWTLQAYLLERMRDDPRLVSTAGALTEDAPRLSHSVEHWLAWRYHGGLDAGQEEPRFADPAAWSAFQEAHEAIVADLRTPDGLARAARWYVDRVAARLREYESRSPARQPAETLEHATLRHAAWIAEKRDQLAALEAAPLFPGYRRAPVIAAR
jgi:hypothetical protein